MNTYYCKCGRTVQKSTAAENTGNRDVKGCDGCPYLMPWGTDKYIEGHGFVKDVQGYECRMSRDLDYATRFGGSVQDKCTCYIASLDFEFLERVSNWIAENYPNSEIFGCFCRANIRPTDYVSNGRYRMSICCAQNKKGIAAKAALLERFFYPDGSRKDLTPEKERALIMSRIAAGKEFAHKKEDKLESRQYKNQYGTVFAVRKKAGVPRLMCRVEEDGKWVISGVLAARTGEAKTEEELQAVLDRTAEELGWTECKDTDAPTGAAAVTTGGNAASAESTAETLTTSESGEDANNSPGLPSAPADTSPQPPKAADAVPATRTTASSASGNGSLPAFDYSGLDDQTVQDLHLAEREFAGGKRMAEMGLRRMADGVSIAHDALCGGVVHKMDNSKHGNRGEDTFRRWCESIGVGKSTAYKLLQVAALFDASSPRQQQVLEELSPSLLYAAAKPSAPADLVQAVKSGDITTHKQYQDLLKENQQLRADRVNALNAAAAAEAARDAALADVDGLHEQNRQLHDTATNAQENADAALRRATEAELRAKEAEKQLAGARQVADAARMRADKYQREAEAAKAQPVAAAVDEDEINRRAHTLADELTAPLRSELEAAKAAAATPEQIELDTRNAYDSLLLAGRAMQNAWKSVKPQLAKLPPDTRAGAINQLTNTLTEIQTEAIKCL